MKAIKLPTLAVLDACFRYDEETGVLYWKKRPRSHFYSDGAQKRFNTQYSGKPAGSTNKPERGIRINLMLSGKNQLFTAHRVIWYLVKRVQVPANWFLHHRNEDKTDNRMDNLFISQKLHWKREEAAVDVPAEPVVDFSTESANDFVPEPIQVAVSTPSDADDNVTAAALLKTQLEAHTAYLEAKIAMLKANYEVENQAPVS